MNAIPEPTLALLSWHTALMQHEFYQAEAEYRALGLVQTIDPLLTHYLQHCMEWQDALYAKQYSKAIELCQQLQQHQLIDTLDHTQLPNWQEIEHACQNLLAYQDRSVNYTNPVAISENTEIGTASSTTLDFALNCNATRAEALTMLGIEAANRQDFVTAQQHLEAALSLDPKHYRIWSNLGNVAFEDAELATAEQYYRKAIELCPTYAIAHHNLASVLRKQNRISEAVASIKHAQKLERQHWNNIDQALVAQSKWKWLAHPYARYGLMALLIIVVWRILV